MTDADQAFQKLATAATEAARTLQVVIDRFVEEQRRGGRSPAAEDQETA